MGKKRRDLKVKKKERKKKGRLKIPNFIWNLCDGTLQGVLEYHRKSQWLLPQGPIPQSYLSTIPVLPLSSPSPKEEEKNYK